MKSSNLAERLEEFEAVVQSLQMSVEPATRRMAAPESCETPAEPARPARRGFGARTIQIRDQGLRSFRVF
jgi:hypothetical protein